LMSFMILLYHRAQSITPSVRPRASDDERHDEDCREQDELDELFECRA